MKANNTGTATFAILWHMQYQYTCKLCEISNKSICIPYISTKPPKTPHKKKQNEFESRIEKCIKRKTNKKNQ